MNNRNVWESANQKKVKQIDTFAKKYIDFISDGKTERECTDLAVNMLEDAGFIELDKAIASNKRLKAGDRVYSVCMNKSVVAFTVGTEPIEHGMNILGAHIDSPRLDIKQNPLYETDKIAYLDTHYYGGVKKYQWVTLPLAIHGVVAKKDGTIVEINIGEDEDDPVFFISDLLIHLASEQLEKKASKVIEGEALDIVVGSMPLNGADEDKKEAVKNNILKLLKMQYDIEEDDFVSAELEVVPAGRAREAGIDKSMVLGYGHDDRVCAYPSLMAMLEVKKPTRTTSLILVDKEEIGSVGATGMRSEFYANSVAELINLINGEYSELMLKRCMAASYMLSSDVCAAFDPSYADKFEKKNASVLGGGMVFSKYTGSRGKSGSNDANAEYIAALRKIFDEKGVIFQTGEIGKVDVGGGGTIAYVLALYGMNVIDCGVAVLNMHAPFEAISKADVYETFEGYKVFLSEMGK
ncbi:MAG: aminopeptidase [Lachnospiraceae bacterium]|nr:aminopeptidase [Candidatus Colinaster equi]